MSSAICLKYVRQANEQIANLKYVKEKLMRLRHYFEDTDWRNLRRYSYVIDDEIKRINRNINVYRDHFDAVGGLTEEMANNAVRSYCAAVVYFEFFYERAARWDKWNFNYVQGLNYERVLGKRCAPCDSSYLRLFVEVAYSDKTAIDKVIKAEAEFVKKEAENHRSEPFAKPETYLPYKFRY